MYSLVMTDSKIRKSKIYNKNMLYHMLRYFIYNLLIYIHSCNVIHKIFTYLLIYLWDEMKIDFQCLAKYLL